MAEQLCITGGRPLNGTIRISGMKNAVLPILYAVALTSGQVVLHNVPKVSDVETTLGILSRAGVRFSVRREDDALVLDGSDFRPCSSPEALVRKIRASSYLWGVELGRFGQTAVSVPGGCNTWVRPFDFHLRGFEKMGASMSLSDGVITGYAEDGLNPADITLSMPSVGATVNFILAAVLTRGTTHIRNAAKEPHIESLCEFLNLCGAKISGGGTNHIQIEGVERLGGCEFTIIPDMIEAGTYMAAVAATGGHVTLLDVIPEHLEAVTATLRRMGVTVWESEHSITVESTGNLISTDIVTGPYPEFPTDMQPQFAPLLAIAEGKGSITETISQGRFTYLNEMMRAGIMAGVEQSTSAHFSGCAQISPAEMSATDLRGGAAMVIAALCAKGESVISSIQFIDRGYDDLLGKLSQLGAVIQRRQIAEDGTYIFLPLSISKKDFARLYMQSMI